MATVLRVKRRNSCESLHTLVIACKKQKTSDDNSAEIVDSENVAAVLQLTATVQLQDDVVQHIAKTLSKDQLKQNYKQNTLNTTGKIRIQTRENSKQQRYKVISCFRSLNSDLPQLDEKGMTVIDVEDSVSCAATKTSSDQDNDYVYDLYYTNTDKEIELENVLTIYNTANDLVFDQFKDSSDFFVSSESDDSNAESNWRNDYPDSDYSYDSFDDDDIHQAVRNIKIIGEDSDLSDEDVNGFTSTDEELNVDGFDSSYHYYVAKRDRKKRDEEESGEWYITEPDDDDDDSD